MNNLWKKFKDRLSGPYNASKRYIGDLWLSCESFVMPYILAIKKLQESIQSHIYNNSGIIILAANYLLIFVEILSALAIITNPSIIIMLIIGVIPAAILYSYLHNPIMNLIRRKSMPEASTKSTLAEKLENNQYVNIQKIISNGLDKLDQNTVVLLLYKYPQTLKKLLSNNNTKAIINDIETLDQLILKINILNYSLILDLFENAKEITATKELSLKNKLQSFAMALSYAITELASYAYGLFIISSGILSFFAVTSNLPIIIGFLALGSVLLTPLIMRKALMLKTIHGLESNTKQEDNQQGSPLNNLIYAMIWAYLWCVLIFTASHYLVIAVPLALPYVALIIPLTTFAVFMSMLFNFEDYALSKENLITNISVIILYTSLGIGVVKIAMTLGLVHINIVHNTIMAVMLAQVIPCLWPLIILTIIAIPIFANFPKVLINSVNPILKSYRSAENLKPTLAIEDSAISPDKKGPLIELTNSSHPNN